MNNKITYTLALLLILLQYINAQENSKSNFSYHYSLKELSELTISTGSIKPEKRKSAPSNITIITNQMIEEKGYKTLVDICQGYTRI